MILRILMMEDLSYRTDADGILEHTFTKHEIEGHELKGCRPKIILYDHQQSGLDDSSTHQNQSTNTDGSDKGE